MGHSLFLGAVFAVAARAYTITDVDQFMTKNIDPIVLPGTYASHMHSFFGSDAVTKDLPTSAELRQGCATADNPNDFSVYWIPTLYRVDSDGTHTPIAPERFIAYYNFEKTQAETAIPEDFNVVAGNAAGNSTADVIKGSEVTWLCEGEDFDADGKDYAEFPRSTCSGKVLQSVLWFPDCVNPDTLESAYSSGGTCASGMKAMPQLRFSIRYDISSIGSWSGVPRLELACGSSYCFHGDFINGWLPETAEAMVTALTKERSLQALSGPNGNYRTKSICNTTAADADPDNGTSDYEESLGMMAVSSDSKTTTSSSSPKTTSSTSYKSQTKTTAKAASVATSDVSRVSECKRKARSLRV
ncbi:hypothetical protein GQ53DRAFT_744736 [Thozetella sp. PMI_491]|nr:hypothetical protein GQ53DRAFT_744736 [Thozetella sp. PMI_491]